MGFLCNGGVLVINKIIEKIETLYTSTELTNGEAEMVFYNKLSEIKSLIYQLQEVAWQEGVDLW